MSITATIKTHDGDNIELNAGVPVLHKGTWYRLSCTEAADNKAYRKREWLVEQYHGAGRTLKEIGDACGVSPMTINQWLVRHGIPSRPRGRRKIE